MSENELRKIHNHFLELLSDKNLTDDQRFYIQQGLLMIQALIYK